MKLSEMKAPEKFTIREVERGEALYSPPKADFVTIDKCAVYENDGEFENSASEWCYQLHGELVPFIELEFSDYKGFIYLFSRRYCSYILEGLEDFMRDEDYDAVFIDNKGFYFCGNEVNNTYYSAQEVYDDGAVNFVTSDYGDDCCGYHDSYYVHDGVLYSLHEVDDA